MAPNADALRLSTFGCGRETSEPMRAEYCRISSDETIGGRAAPRVIRRALQAQRGYRRRLPCARRVSISLGSEPEDSSARIGRQCAQLGRKNSMKNPNPVLASRIAGHVWVKNRDLALSPPRNSAF
jgi:hypothetical protein